MPIDFPNSPSNGATYTVGTKTWQFDGATWNLLQGTAGIATGAVTEEKIAASAVTESKIHTSAITHSKINDGAVTAGKIASNAVTEAKINDGAVTQNKLASGLSGITVTTTALRSSVVPSPFTGQFIFLTDTSALQRWDGSSWVSAIVTVPPSAPLNVAVVSNTAKTVTLSFTPPSNDGGSTLLSYYYALSTDGGNTYSADANSNDSSSPITITGLSVATTYHVKLKASNAIGLANSYSAPISFTTNSGLSASILIVGGGGSGGTYGGGGGGGGVAYASSKTVTPGTYSIVVGAGSTGTAINTNASTGSSSSAFGQTCGGGGDGGRYNNYPPGLGVNSGGRGAYQEVVSPNGTAPTATSGFTVYGGYAGGAFKSGEPGYPSGGGAGAGGNGQSAPNTTFAGGGANGIQNSITGTNLYWAAGGGGGIYYTHQGTAAGGGLGGGGGGGGGSTNSSGGGSALNSGENGTSSSGKGGAGGANTGSGGGGTSYDPHNGATTGGNGGSGCVIMRYLTSEGSEFSLTGGTTTTDGSYTVRSFLSTGTVSLVIA